MFDSDYTLLLLLGVGSVLCSLASYAVYICQQLRGRLDPAPVGWLVTLVVLTVNCVSQWGLGATWSTATIVAQAAGSLIIVGICMFQGGWRLTAVDVLALAIAFIALACAQVLESPALGTILTLVADGAGMWLIVRKAACVPGAERPLPWALSVASGPFAIAAAAMTGGGMLLLSPVYLLAANVSVIIAIRSQRWKRYDAAELWQTVVPVPV